MIKQDIIALIQSRLVDAQVIPEGADCSFTVTVVSEEFAGLMPAKRQQQVLNVFSEQLRTGELHALSVKAFTPAEWAKQIANADSGLTTISLG